MTVTVKTRARFFAKLILSSTLSLSLGLIPLFAIDASAGQSAPVVAEAPAQKPKQPSGQPPREALKACEGKAQGETCSVSLRDGPKVSGTCRAPERSAAAACMPSGGPSGPAPRG